MVKGTQPQASPIPTATQSGSRRISFMRLQLPASTLPHMMFEGTTTRSQPIGLPLSWFNHLTPHALIPFGMPPSLASFTPTSSILEPSQRTRERKGWSFCGSVGLVSILTINQVANVRVYRRWGLYQTTRNMLLGSWTLRSCFVGLTCFHVSPREEQTAYFKQGYRPEHEIRAEPGGRTEKATRTG